MAIVDAVLTQRERMVLRFASYGYSAEGTAKKMHLSINTVKYYRGNAIGKLNAKNITHAVAIAYEEGIFRV